MKNPILTEIKRLAPDYVPTKQQVQAAEAAEDPEKVAGWLEQRLNDARADAARHLGISPTWITPEEGMTMLVNLDRAIKGAAGSDDVFAERLTPHLLAIGKRMALARLNPVTAMYWGILGRAPDQEGYNFWYLHYIKGGDAVLPQLVQAMVDDKARGAK